MKLATAAPTSLFACCTMVLVRRAHDRSSHQLTEARWQTEEATEHQHGWGTCGSVFLRVLNAFLLLDIGDPAFKAGDFPDNLRVEHENI